MKYLPDRKDFSVSPAEQPEDPNKTDLNGYTFNQVNDIIRSRPMEAAYNVPGITGRSKTPHIITDYEKEGFQYGMKFSTEELANQAFVNRLDESIPRSIPTNIPIILQNTGIPEAQVFTAQEIAQQDKNPAKQRVLRKYYVIG